MPVSLRQIIENVGSVSLDIDGETLNLEYYPGKLTDKMFNEINSMKQMEDINEKFVALVKSWDVYEDDDKTIPFPLDVERLKEIPVSLKTDILLTIMGEVRPQSSTPKRKKTKNS